MEEKTLPFTVFDIGMIHRMASAGICFLPRFRWSEESVAEHNGALSEALEMAVFDHRQDRFPTFHRSVLFQVPAHSTKMPPLEQWPEAAF